MIDYGQAFQRAADQTRLMLFSPFSLPKWFALALPAWLAGFLVGDMGGNLNFNTGSDYSPRGQAMAQQALDFITRQSLFFWLLVLALIALLACLFSLLMVFLGARGQFLLFDNTLHNRDAIKEPWKRYARPANEFTLWFYSLQLLSLILMFGFFALALAAFWPYLLSQQLPPTTFWLPWLLGFLALLLSFLPLSIFLFILRDFAVPLMARHSLTMPQALGRIWRLFRRHWLDFIVYTLIRTLMGFAFYIYALLAGCLTCCLGFFPYLNSVVTLPYHIFRQTFVIDCLHRLDPDSPLWPEHKFPPPLT
ncbi:MAG: hypothetical protein HC904_05620 [Blastochloris sp.]|nr:hypothetical protein [Blastochloris sp.]